MNERRMRLRVMKDEGRRSRKVFEAETGGTNLD